VRKKARADFVQGLPRVHRGGSECHNQSKRILKVNFHLGACTIKLFTAVIYYFRNKIECLSLVSYPMLRMTHPSRNFFVLSLFCVYACLYG
jgi:hypothetical protein